MRYVIGVLCVCVLGVIALVGCSENGGGADPCESVSCEDIECKVDGVCNPDDGMCEYTTVMDGTSCTEGECLGGVCAPVGAFPCTEQGIRDAISEGGGPHVFACDGTRPVVTMETIFIDKNVILDGGGKLTVDGGQRYHGILSVPVGVTAELRGFTVTGCRHWDWGGIFNGGTLAVANSTVFGNSAVDGGGIRNEGTLTLTNSTISGNTAVHGTGIYNFGTLNATNVTLSGNTAPSAANFDSGAAFRNQGTMTLTSSTVSGNSAQYGGDIAQYHHGPLIITNTVVDGTCYRDTETITSNGYNIESPGNTCGFDQTGDQSGVTAGQLNLGPLSDKGGPTMTHALQSGSAAIDRIPQRECLDHEGNPLTTDQRGEPRDSMCDVGAFEVQP